MNLQEVLQKRSILVGVSSELTCCSFQKLQVFQMMQKYLTLITILAERYLSIEGLF
jgi:hypothetical protein